MVSNMEEYKQHYNCVELVINGEFQGNYDTKDEAHREARQILRY